MAFLGILFNYAVVCACQCGRSNRYGRTRRAGQPAEYGNHSRAFGWQADWHYAVHLAFRENETGGTPLKFQVDTSAWNRSPGWYRVHYVHLYCKPRLWTWGDA